MVNLALFMIFPALMAFAGINDFLSMTIPNRLCFIIVAAFFPVAALAGFTPLAMAGHFACATTALAIGFAAFSFGWVGGGDAKLFGAAALWLGWQQIVVYAAIAGMAGGVLALAYLALRLMPAGFVLYAGRRIASFGQPDIPYGVALAAAALIVYPHSAWMSGMLH